MTTATRAITRLQDADDAPVLGAGQNGHALTWDNAAGAFVATARDSFGAAGADTVVTFAGHDATMNLKLYTGKETFHGERDDLWGLVYNWAGATTVQDASHPRWGLGFEFNYKPSAGGPIWDECYLLWDDVTAGVSLRPLMTIVDRSTRKATHAINGKVVFSRTDGTNSAVQIEDSIVLLNSAPLRAENNGVSFLFQKDSSGTYCGLIYLTSADQIYIGNGTLDIVLGGANTLLTGNLLVAGAYNTGNGVGAIAIKNATTVPDSWFGEGGLIYVEAGALKYKGSNGTVTTLAGA